jgi:hypothetical protein
VAFYEEGEKEEERRRSLQLQRGDWGTRIGVSLRMSAGTFFPARNCARSQFVPVIEIGGGAPISITRRRHRDNDDDEKEDSGPRARMSHMKIMIQSMYLT